MNSNDFDISVIIINYNSSDYTIDCVKSIIKHTSHKIKYNIIIVDNNSDEQDFKNVSTIAKYTNVKIVKSRINLGFSCGHMLGVQFTKPKYYFFLNNDCILLNDCLSILFNFCIENPMAALCSPQLYSKSMERHSTFDYFPTLSSKFFGTGLLRLIKKSKYPDKTKIYNEPLKVDLVSGSTLFVNSEPFDKIGGFDTTYFLYCEEEDLALRFTKSGYDVYLIPEARVQHFGGGSTNKNLEINKEFYISFLYFYYKHYGFLKTQLLKIFLFLKLIKKSIKSFDNFILAFFVLLNAKSLNSLKHKQKIENRKLI